MSTTHAQPGLSSDQRSNIRSAILSTRQTLEDELRRQLEKYGIFEDRKLPQHELTHLSAEELHTRHKIDAAIERELESTEGDLERSITNYVREATKTYLNRFVALKTIEVRGLVEETITGRPEYGNRSYIHHTVAEIAGELTNTPDDGFGAALDLAYQEIGAEIRMIFEESEHTAIDLDAQVREDVLDELDAIDDEAWESDEALGWVYQYFGEQEREDIDERVGEENYKIAGTDIATKTQLFTPRYIVEWMVDNSLGRLWLEMQGERTNIDDEDNCFYLAPLEDSLIDRETKAVEDITVLDPACGSGHMLFYAFDVLYQMYLEESEVPKEYIPREILRNNLYGMDIDSGAAQITALSLYLKAKAKSPDMEISQLNILSADAVLINGDKKQEILDRARSDIEKEILGQVWRSFDNIREYGSLIRVEEHINNIIEEHRDTVEASGQAKFTGDGSFATQSTFVSDEGGTESWRKVKSRLLNEISDVASQALDRNEPIEEMFVTEVEKGVRLLDIFLQDYDVVVTNPPYLGSAKMGTELKKFVKDNYKGSRDLYTAFIERCSEFSGNGKYASLVTPENFMFLYSFRGLRKQLIKNKQFVEGVHLSRYGFDQQKDAYTIPFLLRNADPKDFTASRFYRMTENQEKYENYEDKIDGLNEITEVHREGKSHEDVYSIDQNSFTEIGRTPFVYWFGEDTLSMFSKYPSMDDVADVVVGLQTGDDDRFVRKWWEVPVSEIGSRYRRFQMSGTNSEYYDYAEDFVDWISDGEDIKGHESSRPQNEDYYFQSGLTFRNFGNYLTARLQTEEMIFSQKSNFVRSESLHNYILLANFNSTIHRFIMDGLNSGLNYNVGDGKRLPIKKQYEKEEDIKDLVGVGIESRKNISKITETSADFDPRLMADLLKKGPLALCAFRDKNRAHILTTRGIIDSILFDEYDVVKETKQQMYENLPSNVAQETTIEGLYSEYPPIFEDYINTRTEGQCDVDTKIATLQSSNEDDLRQLSTRTELSPLTVANLRDQYDLHTQGEKVRSAGCTLSFILAVVFGRWNTNVAVPTVDDEILPFESSSGLEFFVKEGIKTIFDDSYQGYEQLHELLGRDPVEWFRNRFFRYHHVDEYKPRGERSPIYWQLESPNGGFSCFVYYHEIDQNTLPKLRGQYLDPRIGELENELETLNSQTSGESPEKELLNRKQDVQNDLEDIREFRNTIDEMIDDGVTVDVEKGIWENIKEWDQYEVLETGLPKLKSSYSR